MKIIKTIAASCLFSIGFICLLGTVFNVTQPAQTEENQDKALVSLVLGLPLTISGSWLIRSLSQERQKQQESHIRSTFFNLIAKTNGSITVLDLAMEAKISGKKSQQYLEDYSREFNADFEITDEGNIIYQFAFLPRDNSMQQWQT